MISGISKDKYFLYIAGVLSQQSKCCSKKVGSLIVKDTAIISSGVNGTKTGRDNCVDHSTTMGWLEEDENGNLYLPEKNRHMHSEWSSIYEYHAEQNTIDSAIKNNIDINGATLYCTHSPCMECAKRISNSGINKLVYMVDYDRSNDFWIGFLKSHGVEVSKMDVESDFDDLKKDFVFDYVKKEK